MTLTKRIFLIITVLLSCVSCDQGTKSLAESLLSQHEVLSFLGDTFRIQLAHNTGAFLSMGSALPEAWRAGIFSAGVSVMLLGLLAYILFAKSHSSVELLALSLLLAGGIGNLIDRVMFGYVIDFMNIGIGSIRTGIFNVADIAVTFGVLLLIAELVLSPEKEKY
jgi:signal peptidase II